MNIMLYVEACTLACSSEHPIKSAYTEKTQILSTKGVSGAYLLCYIVRCSRTPFGKGPQFIRECSLIIELVARSGGIMVGCVATNSKFSTQDTVTHMQALATHSP